MTIHFFAGKIRVNILKFSLAMVALVLISVLGGLFLSSDIVMILQNNGVKVPSWVANSLTTVSGVYGVQSFVLSALGVAIAWPVAAAIAATGAAGV